MKTHPCVPLTKKTEKTYRRLWRIKRKLRKTTDLEQRARLRVEMGKANDELWRSIR